MVKYCTICRTKEIKENYIMCFGCNEEQKKKRLICGRCGELKCIRVGFVFCYDCQVKNKHAILNDKPIIKPPNNTEESNKLDRKQIFKPTIKNNESILFDLDNINNELELLHPFIAHVRLTIENLEMRCPYKYTNDIREYTNYKLVRPFKPEMKIIKGKICDAYFPNNKNKDILDVGDLLKGYKIIIHETNNNIMKTFIKEILCNRHLCLDIISIIQSYCVL